MRHWVKSYHNIPAEIDAERYPSVTALLDEAMGRYVDKVAFCAFGQTVTFTEIDRQSRALAAYLQKDLGIRKGDRIAVMLPNLIAFPIAFIAITRIGAVQVNVNPLYTPRELEHQLNDAGVNVMIVFNGSTGTLAEVIGHTGVKTVLSVTPGDGTGVELPTPPVDPRLTTTRLSDAIAAGARLTLDAVPQSGDDLLVLQYTGGTTGFSKGASLTHRNLLANMEQFRAFMPSALEPGREVIVTAIPLYHIFALMVNFLSYFAVGAENWLVANPRDMDGFVDVLKKARPTVFSGVNTLYAGLTAHPKLAEVDWSRLKLAVGGGAAVIGATSDRWRTITGTFIREGYGLSETSPIVSFNPLYISEFTGSTGLPMPSTDVRLLDDDNKDAAIGEAGEICVKGPQVMVGYWEKPEANAAAFTEDGYFRTGDVGVFDEKGFLRIVDRKKDMVIVSGFNVYPNEVEAVATGMPGVFECACIGVPDDKTGEAVKLFIVKAPGAALSEAEVIAYCRGELAGYKVPKLVSFIDALPKSVVGKILRRELRGVA